MAKPRAPTSAEAVHRNNVLLEHIQSQMQVIIEGQQAGFESLRRELREVESKLSARITILEQVVRKNSEDIARLSDQVAGLDVKIAGLDAKVAGLDTRVAGLEAEVMRLRHDLDRCCNRTDFEALERRVSAIEAHLGLRP